MTLLTNSAEGITPSGTTPTNANSGGASGSAFDTAAISIGASATLASDSTRAAHGSLSLAVTTPVTATNSYAGWTTSMGTQTQVWFREYLFYTANPGATHRVWTALNAGSNCGSLQVTSTGKLRFVDSAAATVITSTASIPLNQWFRAEGFLIGSATVGQVEFKLFTGADDVTPAETQTSAATVNTLNVATAYRFGVSGSTASISFWMDDLGLSSTGYIGPAVTTASVQQRSRPVMAAPLAAIRGWLARRAGVFGGTGPPLKPPQHPVQARALPQRGGSVSHRAGTYGGTGAPVKAAPEPVQARQLPRRGGSVTRRAGPFAGTGPPLKALAGAVSARLRVLPPRGRTAGRSGVQQGTGPPLTPARGPVRARQFPQRGGRTASRAGTFTATAATPGPPVYPLGHPVQARQLPRRGGHVSRTAGTPAGTGPPLKPLSGPVRAQSPPPRGGRAATRAGTLTAGGPQVGPPVYPLGHPVQAKRLPARAGSVSHRAGTFAGTGPPVPALKQPLGQYRRQPPPPARGRVMSLHGTRAGTGPPAVPLRRPVRGQPQAPVLYGRADSRAGVALFAPPPPFTIGALTASDAPAAVLTAAGATSALTASTAPQGTLTATDQRTGGPG